MRNLLLAGIALVALAAPAAAADMPLKAPAPVAIDIWTGGYVGANVGYDWGRDTSTLQVLRAPAPRCLPGCVGNYYSILSAQAASFTTEVSHNGSSTAVRRAITGSFTTSPGRGTACSASKSISRASRTRTAARIRPLLRGVVPAPAGQWDDDDQREDRHARHPSRPRRRSLGTEHPPLHHRRSCLRPREGERLYGQNVPYVGPRPQISARMRHGFRSVRSCSARPSAPASSGSGPPTGA